MKLTQEEIADIEKITERLKDKWAYDIGTFANDCEYLLDIVQKLRHKPRERFTYEMRECDTCDGVGEVGAVISMTNDVCDIDTCKACGGLGKVRVKVKSNAHNA